MILANFLLPESGKSKLYGFYQIQIQITANKYHKFPFKHNNISNLYIFEI